MCLVYSVLPESSIGDVLLTDVVFDGNVASIGGMPVRRPNPFVEASFQAVPLCKWPETAGTSIA